jgi:hypothetical protein
VVGCFGAAVSDAVPGRASHRRHPYRAPGIAATGNIRLVDHAGRNAGSLFAIDRLWLDAFSIHIAPEYTTVAARGRGIRSIPLRAQYVWLHVPLPVVCRRSKLDYRYHARRFRPGHCCYLQDVATADFSFDEAWLILAFEQTGSTGRRAAMASFTHADADDGYPESERAGGLWLRANGGVNGARCRPTRMRGNVGGARHVGESACARLRRGRARGRDVRSSATRGRAP